MDILECKDESAWVAAINSWFKKQTALFSPARIFLPAGDTPRPLYKNWEQFGAPFSSSVRLIQLDEIITGDKKNAFQNFFKETLPSFQNQFEYIDTADSSADLALLGIGLNGHVAFHEPGLSPSFYSGCLTLNPETIQHGKLYPDVKVVTYGVQAFLQAKAILILARGEGKRPILQEVLKSNCQLPAAQLKKHSQLSIVTDFILE